jgi:hypothetical protein
MRGGLHAFAVALLCLHVNLSVGDEQLSADQSQQARKPLTGSSDGSVRRETQTSLNRTVKAWQMHATAGGHAGGRAGTVQSSLGQCWRVTPLVHVLCAHAGLGARRGPG